MISHLSQSSASTTGKRYEVGQYFAPVPFRQVFVLIGEPGWFRTNDNLIKSQVLYQLSYGLKRADNREWLEGGQPLSAASRSWARQAQR